MPYRSEFANGLMVLFTNTIIDEIKNLETKTNFIIPATNYSDPFFILTPKEMIVTVVVNHPDSYKCV